MGQSFVNAGVGRLRPIGLVDSVAEYEDVLHADSQQKERHPGHQSCCLLPTVEEKSKTREKGETHGPCSSKCDDRAAVNRTALTKKEEQVDNDDRTSDTYADQIVRDVI